ncbi:MAG: glycosyltransferase [Ilumatobacteraceae bacterium]
MIVTDLRFPGGTSSSLIEEVTAATTAGYEVGLLHVESPRIGPTASVGHRVRALVDDGPAHLVLPGERVETRAVIVKHPMVFAAPMGGRMSIEADQVIVTVGQVPADEHGVYYEPRSVDDNILEAFGRRAIWIPVSSAVRSALGGDSADVDMSRSTWVEIIEVPADPIVGRVPTDDPRLVIGRHSRPDRLKWPGDADDMRAAYPVDGSVRVRVLGGADPVGEVLGAVPDTWEVSEFGSIEPGAFLAELDAFVYFHHADLTEAFGRTILEALAAGVPAVVPSHFEPIFGEACLYATPHTAVETVRALCADPERRRSHVERARRLAAERFGHATHVRRIEELCGPPGSIDPVDVPPVPPVLADVPIGHRPSFTTTLVAALGAETGEVEALLAALEQHRRRAPGFVPVVAITVRRPPLAERLGIETVVITSRRNHSGPPGAWPEYARRRLRQLAIRHRVDNVVVANPAHEDAWIALQVHRSPSDDR